VAKLQIHIKLSIISQNNTFSYQKSWLAIEDFKDKQNPDLSYMACIEIFLNVE